MWLKDFNVRTKTLEHIGLASYFLNRTPIAQETRARIDKWDYTKLKSFCTSKETVTRIKRQPTNGRKTSLAIKQIKHQYQERAKKLNSKRTNNPIKK
jgi:hypothetical protein